MSLATPLTAGYGLAEAARVCGVSKPTVRRRKAALVRAGAVADDTGWRIPPSALVAVGLLDTPVTPLPVRSVAPVDTPEEDRLAELGAEVARLRELLETVLVRDRPRPRRGTVGTGPWRPPSAWTHPTAPSPAAAVHPGPGVTAGPTSR
jgi:hypothetical protein